VQVPLLELVPPLPADEDERTVISAQVAVWLEPPQLAFALIFVLVPTGLGSLNHDAVAPSQETLLGETLLPLQVTTPVRLIGTPTVTVVVLNMHKSPAPEEELLELEDLPLIITSPQGFCCSSPPHSAFTDIEKVPSLGLLKQLEHSGTQVNLTLLGVALLHSTVGSSIGTPTVPKLVFPLHLRRNSGPVLELLSSSSSLLELGPSSLLELGPSSLLELELPSLPELALPPPLELLELLFDLPWQICSCSLPSFLQKSTRPLTSS
jgi:hypothetical protein